MNAVEQAMDVYKKAKARVQSGGYSTQDEVIIALWELTQAQQSELAKKDYKISLLESTDKQLDTLDSTQEALAILNKVRYIH